MLTSLSSLQRAIRATTEAAAMSYLVRDVLVHRRSLIVSSTVQRSVDRARAINEAVLRSTGGSLRTTYNGSSHISFINSAQIYLRSHRQGASGVCGISGVNVYIFDTDNLDVDTYSTIISCAYPNGDITIVRGDTDEADNGEVRLDDSNSTNERQGLREEEG